jgi:hypothetical protein
LFSLSLQFFEFTVHEGLEVAELIRGERATGVNHFVGKPKDGAQSIRLAVQPRIDFGERDGPGR